MRPCKKEHLIRQLPSGDQLRVKSFNYKGGPGKKVYIQAGVHGTEVQGSAVCMMLMDAIGKLDEQDLKGEVTLVPNANPHGLNSKVGEHTIGPFDLATGLNWNRAYFSLTVGESLSASVEETKAFFVKQLQAMDPGPKTSSMKRHAWVLQNLAQDADIVLDLHTSARGSRYAYGPPHAIECMRDLHVTDYIELSGKFGGALDEAISCPWMAWLSRFPKTQHVPFGLPLELGDQEHIDLLEAQRDAEGILNLLKRQGVLSGTAETPTQPKWYASENQFKEVFAPHGGLFSYRAQVGSSILEGDLLGELLVMGESGWQSQQICVPYSGRVLASYPSAIVHEGVALYRILVDAKPLSF